MNEAASDAVDGSAPDAEVPEDGPASDASVSGVDGEATDGAMSVRSTPPRSWPAIIGLYALPALALLMAFGVGYLKYEVGTARDGQRAALESVQVAVEGAVAMLSYTPDTAEASLAAASDRLTGAFRESYSSLTHNVVIPGALQQNISASATVVAAASVSATENHAVVLLYVNQSLLVGQDAPTATSSVVEVNLDRVDSRWLISGFTPK